ncbi:MAG TPA: hypothetical protein VIH37_12925, partial [Candidatus Limnocylindrales bacterium]
FATQAGGSLLVALAGLPLVMATGSVEAVLAAAAIAAPIGAVVGLRAWPKTMADPVPAPAEASA